jgi:large subunit ribosomal protein L3
MGRETITVQNVVLVKVIEDRNLLLVKGAVPGAKGGLLRIQYAVKGQDK